MPELFLIVRVASLRMAVAATIVDSVVEVDHLTPVPRVAANVAGLFALRSRVLTVIDGRVALGLPAPPRALPAPGVIVAVDGHGYVLLVDEVEDVVDDVVVEDCPAVLGPAWARAAIGQLSGAALCGGVVLLVDAAALIVPAEAADCDTVA